MFTNRRVPAMIVAVLVAALTILVLVPFSSAAHASKPRGGLTSHAQFTSIAAAPQGGVWAQLGYDALTAKTRALGGAPDLGSAASEGSIVSNPAGNGYYIVTVGGKVISRGTGLQSWSDLRQGGYDGFEIVGAAVTADGAGLWAVDARGRVWTLGDARSYGDRVGSGQTPTGIVGTPSGRGYYVVEADGGVFAFGDAVFLGSTGGKKPAGRHVTGMALYTTATVVPGHPGRPGWCSPWNDLPPCDQVPIPDRPGVDRVTGYWLVDDGGGISTFGDAPFLGSAGASDDAVTSITALPDRGGYAIVHGKSGQAEVFRPDGHYWLS